VRAVAAWSLGRWASALAGLCLLVAGIVALAPRDTTTGTAKSAPLGGIHKIQHVVIIMQENRSFDSYFGTFPGADGIPHDANGRFTVCLPNPHHHCVRPFHDGRYRTGEGPHNDSASRTAIDHGRMDGFLRSAAQRQRHCGGHASQAVAYAAACAGIGPGSPDSVMGFADNREIPNYWTWAHDFVLHDHMFEPTSSWSRPAHLYLVSEWSALCRKNHPLSCRNNNTLGARNNAAGHPIIIDFAWTDITYLLHKANVSWAYYVSEGSVPDCYVSTNACSTQKLVAGSPSSWNPLPAFDTVRHDHQVHNDQTISHLYEAAKNGTLPAVSWVIPNHPISEHGPYSIRVGEAYVSRVIDAIMRSPNWPSTAIFLAWDDYGGRYDHLLPPRVDKNGYGLRVPSLLISPYARRGFIDHQTLSFDAFNKFIEDDFLGGQRLDPNTDGRPDRRLSVRDAQPILGDLTKDFDFRQAPRPAEPLPP
jgi:phospholipase C